MVLSLCWDNVCVGKGIVCGPFSVLGQCMCGYGSMDQVASIADLYWPQTACYFSV